MNLAGVRVTAWGQGRWLGPSRWQHLRISLSPDPAS